MRAADELFTSQTGNNDQPINGIKFRQVCIQSIATICEFSWRSHIYLSSFVKQVWWTGSVETFHMYESFLGIAHHQGKL
jgi:hypothetical protein